MTETVEKRCSVAQCGKRVIAKGYCIGHYKRNLRDRKQQTDEISEHHTADFPDETICHSPMPVPYPGFEHFGEGSDDPREFSKTIANYYGMTLNELPNHPKREEILRNLKEQSRIADMDDKSFRSHELYEANPLNKLSYDEKLHCIRTLPVSIVQKLFRSL